MSKDQETLSRRKGNFCGGDSPFALIPNPSDRLNQGKLGQKIVAICYKTR